MRLIPLAKLELEISKEWRTTANNAFVAVKDLAPAERAKAINARSNVWSQLKPKLEKLSAGKCWYCESLETRSDKAVDHFRPKNRVAESAAGESYWWLAFDWHNYRYSCTYCNSKRTFEETEGGKQDHFPLFDETTRGKPEATAADLDANEKPKLLDPTNPDDVRLLTFDVADGSPQPTASLEEDPIAYERAVISIEVYHLKEVMLRRVRFAQMLEVRDRLRNAEELKKGDTYRTHVAWLATAIRPESEYSIAARVMLKSLRGESRLAQTILEDL